MFLLFGLNTKDKVTGTELMTCEVCGWQAPQTIVKRSTKFTLFFIPLFPVKASKYFRQCGHCMAYRPASGALSARA